MPAFLTHWHVLIETARRSQDAGSDLGSLIIDTSALRRRLSGLPIPPQTTPAGAVWHTGPLPEIDYRFPGSDISSMAFLGALAPDIPSFQKGHFKEKVSGSPKLKRVRKSSPLTDRNTDWAALFHTNRSGDLILAFLEQIVGIPSPAIRSQALAFCLGYLSHIATDIALNPWINVLASTYQAKSIPGIFAPPGPHFYAEVCLDEYIATTYFDHELYSWFDQPWRQYIEPAARHIVTSTDLSAQVVDLLTTAIETTYELTEEHGLTFHQAYTTGLQRLQHYLAGRGTFRWLVLTTRLRSRTADPIAATISTSRRQPGTVTVEETLEYAIRLSERLCRRAVSYYASLRNTNATAEDHSQRLAALRHDLHNWDLNTGYTIEVLFDQEITLRYLHNWIHFADLWNNEEANPIFRQKIVGE